MVDYLLGNSIIAWLIGAWFLYSGFAMDVTVVSDGQSVANLQLMHIQQMNLTLGALSIIEGTIAFVGGAILMQMLAKNETPEAKPERLKADLANG
jgi:hypothetical protein